MASLREVLKKQNIEKNARLARVLALRDQPRITPPLKEKILPGDLVDAIPLDHQSPIDVSTEASPNPSVNKEPPSSPPKDTNDNFGGTQVEDSVGGRDSTQISADQDIPIRPPGSKRTREGKEEAVSDQEGGNSGGEPPKRARHGRKMFSSIPRSRAVPVAPQIEDFTEEFSSELPYVPAVDGVDLLARDSAGVRPGQDILARVTHTSYQESLSPVPSSELAGRGGLLISEVCTFSFNFYFFRCTVVSSLIFAFF